MQEEKQARDDLLFLGKRLKGIIDLVPKLERMVSLNNAITERETSLVKLTDEHIEATKNLSELKERIRTFEEQHKLMKKNLHEEARQERIKTEKELQQHGQSVRESVSNETQNILHQKIKAQEDLRTNHKQLHVIENKIKERQTRLDETRNSLKQLGDMING